ncbi:HAD-IA family hydrolase [Verrucomicrobiaceae bacterium R5-34]|uniref:HAD-IA family hydrolase n=1 Tax=Oceaniferula flava TaxID=2800421 RepID=A0AAE2SEX5_9BACT|nr:HAD-IA family hydrolase [Oceaniferula flavus]MBK1831153.1 HAD-IA family hydrolase [Verrucomicrobiaceae bacterium R5-34]MBK1855669.1 HAD-IA family hydrolase [Oceaniferula flavus]MBM1136975.1 HAD-IA family hydrolase [Oceaniferula flavus]
MNYRAIIFDFDGTLADTLDEAFHIYNKMAKEHDLRAVSEDEIPGLRDMKLNQFLSHLGIPKRRVPKLLYQGTKQLKESIGSLPLFEGLEHVLPALRTKIEHVGILTSNSVENVNLFLETHGLENVFTFVSSTSKLTGKAKHLRAIRKTFSLEASEMIYVGDEIRDIVASKKAGIPVAAVGWGFNSPEALKKEQPDHFCDSVEELLMLCPKHLKQA